jgi:HEXXH motif-containing protein
MSIISTSTLPDYGFYPCAKRALGLDRSMRQSLADSLDYIAQQACGWAAFDANILKAMIARMNQGERYPPSTFGLYTQLVFAVTDGDSDRAARLFGELVRESPVTDGWELLSLSDDRIRQHAERYRQLMDSDPNATFQMLAPPPAVVSDFRRRFDDGYKLLARATPELTAEFDALVSQIVLVIGNSESDYQFDGGSAYMLWGGLFLNASSHQHPVAVAEVLAHESAHILLFGFASAESMTRNPDSELYNSPLRVDPRPMEGIFHATYVSARMHWTMSRLLDSGMLDSTGEQVAAQAIKADGANFLAGYQVLADKGQLTDTGHAVISAAQAYMEQQGYP